MTAHGDGPRGRRACRGHQQTGSRSRRLPRAAARRSLRIRMHTVRRQRPPRTAPGFAGAEAGSPGLRAYCPSDRPASAAAGIPLLARGAEGRRSLQPGGCSPLPTSSPIQTSTCPGTATTAPSSAKFLISCGKAARGALAVIHLTNQRSSRMSPSEVRAPAGAGGNTPQAIGAAGGEEPCRHHRPSQARTLLARAHPRR